MLTLSTSSPAPRLRRSSVVLTFGEATREFMRTILQPRLSQRCMELITLKLLICGVRRRGALLGRRRDQRRAKWSARHVQARRALLALITMVFGLSLSSRDARACQCAGTLEPFEAFVSANQVFEAEIRDESPPSLSRPTGTCGWQVKMLRSWKGATTDRDDPVYDDCWCSAGKLERGKAYIFYAYTAERGLPRVSRCSRIVPADGASHDREELGTPLSVRAPERPWQPTAIAKPPPAPPLRRWRPSRLASCAVTTPGAGHRQPSGPWAFLLGAMTFALTRRRVANVSSLVLALCLLASCKNVLEVPCTNDVACGANGACMDGWCYESAAYCRGRYDCKSKGRCTLADGACVVRNDDDCGQASACLSESRCTAKGEACVIASSRDCQRGYRCARNAACTFKGGKCILESSSDCARSDRCTRWGACTLIEGNCKSTRSADCQKSQMCKSDGMCGHRAGQCRATTSDHCAQGERCRLHGACLPRDDHCIRSCAKSSKCKIKGLCHDDGERCVADADSCKRSKGCLQWGRCTPSKNKRRCQVGSDEDCRNSRLCSEQGQCFAAAGVGCEARSVDDCSRSSGCPDRGGCGLVDKRCGPRSKADCDESTACKKSRICTFRGHRCLPR